MNPQLRARASRLAGLGYPLYVNGKLFAEPVTISHVPAAAGFGAVDPSMGSLGEIVDYGITPGILKSAVKGLFGLGDDTAPAAPAPTVTIVQPAAVAPQPAPMFDVSPTVKFFAITLDFLSTAGLAYHGYRRNNSIGWALVWAILGGGIPIIGWPVALAQGFGEPKRMTANKSSCGCGGMKKNGRRTRRRRRR